MRDTPISNVPSPAPSLFPLLSEIDGATFPVTPDEERICTQAPNEGSQDLRFCCLVAAPSQPGSKLPSQTATPLPDVSPGGSTDQKGGS